MTWKWKKLFGFSWFRSRKVHHTDSGSSTSSENAERKTRRHRSKNKKKAKKNVAPLTALLQQMGMTLKDLECPLCHTICCSPIHQCKNGHLICSNCHLLGLNCPTCDEGYTNVRNTFAEQFISQCSQACKYAGQGCSFIRWKGSEMSSHETGCFYRPIHCIVNSCIFPNKDAIPYREVLDHLVVSHNVHGCENVPAVITFKTEGPLISDQRWLPYFIKAYGCDFYLMLDVRRPCFYAWVWVHPAKPPSAQDGLYGENYMYISSIVFHNCEKYMTINWCGPVHSIRIPASVIIEEGLCFEGGEKLMQHFESDGIFSITLNIEKKSLGPPPEYESKENIPASCGRQKQTHVTIADVIAESGIGSGSNSDTEQEGRGRHHHRRSRKSRSGGSGSDRRRSNSRRPHRIAISSYQVSGEGLAVVGAGEITSSATTAIGVGEGSRI